VRLKQFAAVNHPIWIANVALNFYVAKINLVFFQLKLLLSSNTIGFNLKLDMDCKVIFKKQALSKIGTISFHI
jgi:hypothetical protein